MTSTKNSTLFISNIPFDSKENDIFNIFSQYNPISVKLVVNPDTKISKGFGFITFKSDEDASNVINNEFKINGRTLIVKEAVKKV
jgi:RNA recognition motif-containing protein